MKRPKKGDPVIVRAMYMEEEDAFSHRLMTESGVALWVTPEDIEPLIEVPYEGPQMSRAEFVVSVMKDILATGKTLEFAVRAVSDLVTIAYGGES